MKTKLTLTEAAFQATKLQEKIPFPSEVAGSIRRLSPVIGDIDIVVVVPELEEVLHWAVSILADHSSKIIQGGRRRATFLVNETQVNVWCCLPDEAGACLFYATGPRDYNIAYRRKAKERQWKLNEKGLFSQLGTKIAGATENEIYSAFNKPWKEPALRGAQARSSHDGQQPVP